jgi:hypothetical protein
MKVAPRVRAAGVGLTPLVFARLPKNFAVPSLTLILEWFSEVAGLC